MVPGTDRNQCHQMGCDENATLPHAITATEAQFESKLQQTAEKPKLKDILQKNWLIIFKSVKTMTERG